MKKILIQFDTDPSPSVFDRVVAVDAGVDTLFSYGGVTPEAVEPLVHGAMFTRGPGDLRNTAIFIGGSEVEAGEQLLGAVRSCFFGPMRVSVMMDSNGSNTTAAAAVVAASRHVRLEGSLALVLGGTGPVGRRVAQLLAMQGAIVRVGSRSLDRAEETCSAIHDEIEDAELVPCATETETQLDIACQGAMIIVAAGAAGVELLSEERWRKLPSLRVAIDLNAVPPAGIGGIDASDKFAQRDATICYGALGVGGTKMKIHKTALARLFESSDQILDTGAIYGIAEDIG
jgi:methylenetetrahydrofolate/methylenetetrahydromethanopterin dehydrogenase (NADP+)